MSAKNAGLDAQRWRTPTRAGSGPTLPFDQQPPSGRRLRPCLAPGCPALVSSGRCVQHRRHQDRHQGTSYQRGYTSSKGSAWRLFRRRFMAALVEAGLAPVCGAALPDGPQTDDSRCKAAGRLTFISDDGTGLHLDHEPELSEAERAAATSGDRAAFDDDRRVQLLCSACHAAKHQRGGRALASRSPSRDTRLALPRDAGRLDDPGDW
jgi:hypothetical protein